MNKKPWKSKTLWGALASFIPGVGIPLAALITAMPDETAVAALPPELAILVGAFGTILTVYGRWKSTGSVTFK
jgi:hypothetical protein